MKKHLFKKMVLPLVFIGFSSVASAQMAHDMDYGNMQANSTGATMQHSAVLSTVEGLVKKVDQTKGTIAVAHAASADMPAMTMVYKVKNVSLMDKLKIGQKIRFATDPADAMTVEKFYPSK